MWNLVPQNTTKKLCNVKIHIVYYDNDKPIVSRLKNQWKLSEVYFVPNIVEITA